MNELVARILDAHGGMDRWNGYKTIDATTVSGGGLFPLKGVPQDPSPRRMTAWLHEERSSVLPYGAPDKRTTFAPKDSFAGHQMNTPWAALHRAYLNGEAVWTYLTAPFLLAMNGVQVEEAEAWREGTETWRVLRAYSWFDRDAQPHSGFFLR
jgi:hypothetical protein